MAKKKAPKPSKTDALSIRIDPRVRFGLEMLSRLQRRSVTGVVEWSIADAFQHVQIALADGDTVQFDAFLAKAWAVNELERIARLAELQPSLLTYEEERIMQVISATDAFWSTKNRNPVHLNLALLLDNWERAKPVIMEAAARAGVTGLTQEDLARAIGTPL